MNHLNFLFVVCIGSDENGICNSSVCFSCPSGTNDMRISCPSDMKRIATLSGELSWPPDPPPYRIALGEWETATLGAPLEEKPDGKEKAERSWNRAR